MQDAEHLPDARTAAAARLADASPLACPGGPSVPAAACGLARQSAWSTLQRASVTGGGHVVFDIIDLVWRDLDRMARAGSSPLQLLADPASWVVAGHRIGRALQSLPS